MSSSSRRSLILKAAGRLFHHYGPLKTTVADIAKEARVGVGTVYLEFRNKDAILGALSSTRHRVVLEAVTAAWGDGRPADQGLARALSARLEGFLGCASDGAHAADLFRCSCPAIEQAHLDYVAEEHALFVGFLRAGGERGELSVDDPAEDARALLCAYRAFAPPFAFDTPPDRLRRDVVRVHRIVLCGLLPR